MGCRRGAGDCEREGKTRRGTKVKRYGVSEREALGRAFCKETSTVSSLHADKFHSEVTLLSPVCLLSPTELA